MTNIVAVEADPQANSRQFRSPMDIDGYDHNDQAWTAEKIFVTDRPVGQGKEIALLGIFSHLTTAISKHDLGSILPAKFEGRLEIFDNRAVMHREPILFMVGGVRQEIIAAVQECQLETLQHLLITRDYRVRQATMQGLWTLIQKIINANKYRAISATIQQFLKSVDSTVRKRLAQRMMDPRAIDGRSITTHATFLPFLSDNDRHIREAAIYKLKWLDIRDVKFETRQCLRATYLLLLNAEDWRIRQVAIKKLRDLAKKKREKSWGSEKKVIEASERQFLSQILLPFLGDTNNEVRQAAIEGFAEIAEDTINFQERQFIHKIFQKFLKDTNSNMRCAATKGLSVLASKATEISERQHIHANLLPLLSDTDSNVRYAASQGFGGIYENAGKADERQYIRDTLFPLLRNPNKDVRKAAAYGFAAFAEKVTVPHEPRVIREIMEQLLRDEDKDVREVAVKGLKFLAAKAAEADERQSIRKALKPFLKVDGYIRYVALEGFTALAANADTPGERQVIGAALLPLLNFKDWHIPDELGRVVRVLCEKAVYALERQTVLEALMPFLSNRNQSSCKVAVQGLVAMAKKATAISELQILRTNLIPFLSSTDRDIRQAAIEGFEVLYEKATNSRERQIICESIIPLLENRDGYVREGAAKVFTYLAKKADEPEERQFVRENLKILLSDGSWYVRYEVPQGFRAIYKKAANARERQNIRQDLISFLSNSNSFIREDAAKTFGVIYEELDDAAELQIIRETLYPLLSSSNWKVRQCAVKGFVALIRGSWFFSKKVTPNERRIIRETITPLLEDDDEDVRQAVVEGLRFLAEKATEANQRQIIYESIRPLLKDNHPDVRQAVAETLEESDEIGNERQVILANIIPLLEDQDRGISYLVVREFATFAEKITDTNVRRVIRKTFKRLVDSSGDVQYVAVQGLVALARNAIEASERQLLRAIIIPLLNASDWRVKQAAMQGFGFLYKKITEASERQAILADLPKIMQKDLDFLESISVGGTYLAGRSVNPQNSAVELAIYPDHGNSVIAASDFLRELNHRLKGEGYTPSRTLARAECSKLDCLIRVISHKGNGEAIFQMVYDPKNILMNGEIFTPSEHNQKGFVKKGTRKVGFYSFGGKVVLCLKENPEAPGLERASRILHETLFGFADTGVPNSETILMNGKVFTASGYVEGRGLDEVIQEIEEQTTSQKDKPHTPVLIVNLHQIKVFTILTAPEDGRAQNYILQAIDSIASNRIYRIISIDNERIFGNAAPHPSSRDPRIIVRGHSVIHCLHEKDPDYTNLAQYLCSQTPEAVFIKWLKQVRIEYNYYRNIISYAKITERTRLDVPITEDIARTFYEHLIHIRRGLREKRTLEDTFRLVAPALAEIYQVPRTTPAKRLRSDSKDDSRYPSSSIAINK